MKIVIKTTDSETKKKTFKDFPTGHLLKFNDFTYGIVVEDMRRRSNKRLLILSTKSGIFLGRTYELDEVQEDLGSVTFEIKE